MNTDIRMINLKIWYTIYSKGGTRDTKKRDEVETYLAANISVPGNEQ